MKLKDYEFSNFFNNPPINGGVVFFYGPDYGLSAQRTKFVINKLNLNTKDPFSSSILTFEEIERNPNILVESALTVPMFETKRLVKINLVNEIKSSNFNIAIKSLVDELPLDNCWVIIEAGDIKSSSSLIKLLSNSNHSVLIGCYNDDDKKLKDLAVKIFNDHNIHYNNLDFSLLSSLLGIDRLNTINEIDKLISYIYPNSILTNDDVLGCLADTSIIEIDNIAFSLMLGKNFDFLNKIDAAILRGLESILIVKRPQFWFQKLLIASLANSKQLSHQIDGNNVLKDVFWKHKPYLVQALQLWDSKKIQKVLDYLLDLEAKLKLYPSIDNILLCQSYLSISSLVKRY